MGIKVRNVFVSVNCTSRNTIYLQNKSVGVATFDSPYIKEIRKISPLLLISLDQNEVRFARDVDAFIKITGLQKYHSDEFL